MSMFVVVVCDPTSPVAAAVPQIEGVEFLISNSAAQVKDSGRVDQVECIIFVAMGAPESALFEMYDVCPSVKWFHCFSTGVDCQQEFTFDKLVPRPDVILTNGKGAFSESLGEYILMAALHFNKKVTRCLENRQQKNWDKFTMPVLQGKTIGFVGFGNIAEEGAKRARAFGMKILAFRRSEQPHPLADECIPMSRKLELFERSDFVVCTLPGTRETRDFIGAPEFRAMKSDAVFISCGRGFVVDESALVAALKDPKEGIAAAALDVFKVEPLPKESPLWDCPNLLLTAHNADFTSDYMDLGWKVWQQNYQAKVSGQGFVTVVDKEKGY